MSKQVLRLFTFFLFILSFHTPMLYGQEKLEFREFNKVDNYVENAALGTFIGGIGGATGALLGALVAGPFGAVAGGIAGAANGGAFEVQECIDMDRQKLAKLKETAVPSKITFEHSYSEPTPEVYAAYKKYRDGKEALIIWQSSFGINNQIPVLLELIKKGRPALRATFGQPIDAKGQFMTLTDPGVKAEHDKAIANISEEYNRPTINRLRQSLDLNNIKKLAILSSAPPADSKFEDVLCEIVADAVVPIIWAYISPKVEEQQKIQAYFTQAQENFAQERIIRNRLQTNLNLECEQKQKIEAESKHEREQKLKALADVDVWRGAAVTHNQQRLETEADLRHAQASLNLETESAELGARLIEHLQLSLDREQQRQNQLQQHHQRTLAASVAQTLEQARQLAETEESLTQECKRKQKVLEELEKLHAKLEQARNQISQQSVQSGQEYMSVRSQLSPLRHRAENAEQQSHAKDAEIEELKKQLAEARKKPSYVSVVKGDHLPK